MRGENMQTQNVTLDFCRNDYKDVTVKQYDKDSRNVLIKCTDNGYIYKLDPSIHTCNFKMNTPDNRAIYNPATITEDGKVLIVFNENMVYASGTGKLEIQVIEKATQCTLSSMILTVIIVGSVYSDDTIIASDEFNALTEALLKVESVDETVAQATRDAASALEAANTAFENAKAYTDSTVAQKSQVQIVTWEADD